MADSNQKPERVRVAPPPEISKEENKRLDLILKSRKLEAYRDKLRIEHSLNWMDRVGDMLFNTAMMQAQADPEMAAQAIRQLIQLQDSRIKTLDRKAKLLGLDAVVQAALAETGGSDLPLENKRSKVTERLLKLAMESSGVPHEITEALQEQDAEESDNEDGEVIDVTPDSD